MTPLTAAASAGKHHACELLLLLRADVNKPCSFYELNYRCVHPFIVLMPPLKFSRVCFARKPHLTADALATKKALKDKRFSKLPCSLLLKATIR